MHREDDWPTGREAAEPGGFGAGGAGSAAGGAAAYGGVVGGAVADGVERLARAQLSFVAEPGDPALGMLLRLNRPAEILAAITSDGPAGLALPGSRGIPGLGRAVDRWRSRLAELPTPARLAGWERAGYRLVCPGAPEWPSQLDDLGDFRPVVLWLRGGADLRFSCLRSVSVVGARAATAYGTHVATEFAADLAGRGWAVISGGAFGVDACAHRGALAVGGATVAVLASGLGFGYPKGNASLFELIADTGVMVSECPPDRAPTRPGFLVRNRVIAALSRGTVIVEATRRSGALNTARHARELNRPVMAVPGPITSGQSAGCHDLITQAAAMCVTSAAEVIELISPLGDGEALAARGPAVAADGLDPVTASVLGAVARRSGRGPATIATLAGLDLDTAIRCLGLLAAAGLIERCEQGWRLRKEAAE